MGGGDDVCVCVSVGGVAGACRLGFCGRQAAGSISHATCRVSLKSPRRLPLNRRLIYPLPPDPPRM